MSLTKFFLIFAILLRKTRDIIASLWEGVGPVVGRDLRFGSGSRVDG